MPPNSEDASLDFFLNVGDFSTYRRQMKKAAESLEELGEAAEKAHEKAEGKTSREKNKSLLEKLSDPKTLKRMPVLMKTVKFGLEGMGKGMELLRKGSRDSLDNFLEHYHSMIAWRKEIGMDRHQMLEFSNTLLDSSRQYTFALKDATTIASVLATGAGRAKDKVLGMAGSMAEFRTMTGANEESLADLGKLLTQALGIKKEQEVEKSLGGIQATMRSSNASTAQFMDILAGNRDIFSLWGKDVKDLLGPLSAWGKILLDRGVQMKDLDQIFNKIGTSQGRVGEMFEIAVRNAKTPSEVMPQFISQLQELMLTYEDAKGRGREKVAKDILGGLDPSVFKGLTASVEEYNKALAIYQETYELTPAQQRERLRGQATGLERMKFAWQDLKNEIAGAGSILGPTFEDITSLTAGWVDDSVRVIGRLSRTLAQVARDYVNILPMVEKLHEAGKKQSNTAKKAGKAFWLADLFAGEKFGLLRGEWAEKTAALYAYRQSGGRVSTLPDRWRRILRKHYPNLFGNTEFINRARTESRSTPSTNRVEMPAMPVPQGPDNMAAMLQGQNEMIGLLKQQVEIEEEKKRNSTTVGVPMPTGGRGRGGVVDRATESQARGY